MERVFVAVIGGDDVERAGLDGRDRLPRRTRTAGEREQPDGAERRPSEEGAASVGTRAGCYLAALAHV